MLKTCGDFDIDKCENCKYVGNYDTTCQIIYEYESLQSKKRLGFLNKNYIENEAYFFNFLNENLKCDSLYFSKALKQLDEELLFHFQKLTILK